jgi:hypothetical protein
MNIFNSLLNLTQRSRETLAAWKHTLSEPRRIKEFRQSLDRHQALLDKQVFMPSGIVGKELTVHSVEVSHFDTELSTYTLLCADTTGGWFLVQHEDDSHSFKIRICSSEVRQKKLADRQAFLAHAP